ncbi:hypothetical protein [Streptomyces sp. CBMA123]|uniref:hypothetical protein n=1 Tax=Streptomyces sp. CBMA123 TaxID=1896313 RepID=UPI0016619116|nr:hypothetical protein [Streptomyces sp. CBMA123]MBD0693344.1 hypothetical protein [Streptomyces sp. CBMA123]
MNNLENTELMFQLRDLAEEPAPPPAFDAATSIARGRARLRARQGAAIGAVAAATALTVGFTALLPRAGNAVPTVPPASVAATPVPSPTANAIDGTPLLTDELKVGWLPDWVDREHGLSFSAGSFGSNLVAEEPNPNMRRLQVTLRAPGPEPVLGTHPDEAKVPAAPINGQTAYWVEHPTDPRYDRSSRVLRWQTADGRWAQINTTHVSSAAIPDEDLIRIAESVTGGSRDVPMPLWLSGLPAAVRPDSASVVRSTGPAPWSAQIVLAVEGGTVTVTASPASDPRDFPPTQRCRSEAGLQVCVTTAPAVLPRLDRFGGLPGLLDLVHVTGADESTWTTSNLR